MPAVSKYVITKTLFEELEKVEGFPYNSEELYGFLKETDIKIQTKAENVRAASDYE